MKKITSLLFPTLGFFFFTSTILAQSQPLHRTCATDEIAQQVFQTDPAARARFENTQRLLESRTQNILNNQQRTQAIVTIPVVVHILYDNPFQVTDAMVQKQLDTLNFYYGSQPIGDSLRVYTPFRNTYGRTEIRFCLAQRTPFNTSTTGITRTVTATTFTSLGAHPNTIVAPWDVTKYLNIWVVKFTDGTLGYAPLPGTYPAGSPNIGYVNDYRAFGAGPSTSSGGYHLNNYNLGKTAVHEIGHYFNLLHPWGNGSNPNCTNTDNCADTPPTDGPTYGCPASPKTNACSPTDPGVMFQNHMDYADDPCMLLFTKDQAARMAVGLTSPDRATLLTSNGCQPVIGGPINRDISVLRINNPDAECSGTFIPTVTIINYAPETVTAFSVAYMINNSGTYQTANFTGQNITMNGTATVNLPAASVALPPGSHTITVITFNPVSLSGIGDQVISNDTLTRSFAVLGTVASGLTENFTSTIFPPNNWGVYNPDAGITWKRDPIGNNNAGSAFMNNYRYNAIGQLDFLHTPEITYTGVDSISMSFDIAAATRIAPNNTILPMDTVEVLVTTNCGASFTSIYKKWGAALQTINDPVNPQPNEFFPSGSSQWRTEKIDLSSFAPNGPLQIVFRNRNGFGNNVFIDNVNVKTRILPAALKVDGIQLFPSPFTNSFQIWHLQTPTSLKYVNVYNIAGQKLLTKQFNGDALKIVDVDMSRYAAGIYLVEMVYTDKPKNVQKIIKAN